MQEAPGEFEKSRNHNLASLAENITGLCSGVYLTVKQLDNCSKQQTFSRVLRRLFFSHVQLIASPAEKTEKPGTWGHTLFFVFPPQAEHSL